MRGIRRKLGVLAIAAAVGAIGGCTHKQKSDAPDARAAAAMIAAPTPVDEALVRIRRYEFGQSRQDLTAIHEYALSVMGDKAKREQLSLKLAQCLGNDSSADCKRFVTRELVEVGTANAVPALAALLPDEQMSDMARYALERMEYPEAGAALRSSVTMLRGRALIGVVNSLGARRDGAAVELLVPLLSSPSVELANSAGAALGRIGGKQAAAALSNARTRAIPAARATMTDAYLACAERMVREGDVKEAGAIYEKLNTGLEERMIRIAALRGLVACRGEKAMPALLDAMANSADEPLRMAAASFVAGVPGEAAVDAVASAMDRLPPEVQAVAIEKVCARGGASAVKLASTAAQSGNADVRLAGVRALGSIGDAKSAPLLIRLAATAGPEQQLARTALERLNAAGVDDVLMMAIESGDAKQRVEALRAVGARGATGAIPSILKAIEDEEEPVRIEAYRSMTILGGEKQIGALIARLGKISGNAERTAAEEALVASCRKIGEDPDAASAPVIAAMASADVPTKCALLRVLGRIGGKKASETIRSAISDADAQVSDAAIRTLTSGMDASAAGDLLELAKSATNPAHRVLAMRGYLRLAGNERLKPDARLNMYEQAMKVATRAEDKAAILGGAATVRSESALKFVLPLLADEAVREEAALAAVAIAQSITRDAPSEAVKSAMKRVLEVAKNVQTRNAAEKLSR